MPCFQLSSCSHCLPFHRNSFCHDLAVLKQLPMAGLPDSAQREGEGRGTRPLQECPNTFTAAVGTTGDFNDGSSDGRTTASLPPSLPPRETVGRLDSPPSFHSIPAPLTASLPGPCFSRPERGERADSDGDPLLGRRADSPLLLREKSLRAIRALLSTCGPGGRQFDLKIYCVKKCKNFKNIFCSATRKMKGEALKMSGAASEMRTIFIVWSSPLPPALGPRYHRPWQWSRIRRPR